MPGIIYPGNDNLLQANGLATVDGTGASVLLTGTATVTATCTDADNVPLLGETWPITLAYTGAGGNFQGTIRDTVTYPVPGEIVKVLLTADNGADQRGFFVVYLKVQERQL